MKGIKKIYAGKKQEKTVFENQGSHSPDVSPIRNKPPPLSRLTSLHTIADFSHCGIEDWSKKLHQVFTGRSGRIPGIDGTFLQLTTVRCFPPQSLNYLSIKK